MHILATARLNLRTAEPGDAAFYLALVNDPAFVAQLGDRGIRTLADAYQALLDLGYALLPAWRGQGHAHEAAAADRVPRRLEMRFERVIRLGPADADTNLYAIDINPSGKTGNTVD